MKSRLQQVFFLEATKKIIQRDIADDAGSYGRDHSGGNARDYPRILGGLILDSNWASWDLLLICNFL